MNCIHRGPTPPSLFCNSDFCFCTSPVWCFVCLSDRPTCSPPHLITLRTPIWYPHMYTVVQLYIKYGNFHVCFLYIYLFLSKYHNLILHPRTQKHKTRSMVAEAGFSMFYSPLSSPWNSLEWSCKTEAIRKHLSCLLKVIINIVYNAQQILF